MWLQRHGERIGQVVLRLFVVNLVVCLAINTTVDLWAPDQPSGSWAYEWANRFVPTWLGWYMEAAVPLAFVLFGALFALRGSSEKLDGPQSDV